MDANKLSKKVETKNAKTESPLRALRSPMVKLPDEIRMVISRWCRENDISFASKSRQLWLEFLKKEKLVPQDLELKVRSSREDDLLKRIKELEAELAKAKAAQK